MKNLFNRLALGAAFLVAVGFAPALAQTIVPPIFQDVPPSGGSPISAVSHTGTDAIQMDPNDPRHPSEVMQVSTWETNGKVVFAWDFKNDPGAGGSITTLTSGLSDPDVVVAYRNGELYANLVYIDNAGSGGKPQTRYVGYHWDSGSSSFATSSPSPAFDYWLGDEKVDQHLVPNIDANEAGLVGIVWQQRKVSLTTITYSSLDFPTQTVLQRINFDRSFILGSTIDGQLSDCYRYDTGGVKEGELPGGTGASGTHVPRFIYGRPVLDPPTGLFEQTLRPDVAISQGNEDNAILSAVFIRHYVDGLEEFSIVNKLTVKQTYYSCGKGAAPDSVAGGYKEWSGSGSYPRIAATRYDDPDRIADVEVVIGVGASTCLPDVQNSTEFWEIQNYGKRGTWRAGATTVSLPRVGGQYNAHEAIEPVVSYYGSDTEVGESYLVSWTGRDYGRGTKAQDIISTTLSNGTVLFPLSYSRVNDQVEGNQHTPSVAGRYITDIGYGTVHLFVDDAKVTMSRKLSKAYAGDPTGGGNFRPAPAAGHMALVQAYPNPFDSAVSLRLSLRKGEQLRQLTVLDQLGRLVDQLPVPTGSSEQPLTWRPASTLPSGSYTLKVLTSQRTESIRLDRK